MNTSTDDRRPDPADGTYRCLADLALHVDGYELTGPELAVNRRFTRLTTVVTLHGAGHWCCA